MTIWPRRASFFFISGSCLADEGAKAFIEEVLGAGWHHDNRSGGIVVWMHRCLLLVLRLEKAAVKPAGAVATERHVG